MVQINTFNGPAFVADESIFRILGPSPEFPYTRVNGPGGGGTLETDEEPDHLAGRLDLKNPLAVLTRPDGNPVWIKASAVTYVGPPLVNDNPPGQIRVHARLMVSGRLQLVRESPGQAADILRDHGGPL